MEGKKMVFGWVPMFYYLAHILLIHIAAVVAAPLCCYKIPGIILSGSVPDAPQLKGYSFSLITVYLVCILLIIALFPVCKLYEGYKRANVSKRIWLSYL